MDARVASSSPSGCKDRPVARLRAPVVLLGGGLGDAVLGSLFAVGLPAAVVADAKVDPTRAAARRTRCGVQGEQARRRVPRTRHPHPADRRWRRTVGASHRPRCRLADDAGHGRHADLARRARRRGCGAGGRFPVARHRGLDRPQARQDARRRRRNGRRAAIRPACRRCCPSSRTCRWRCWRSSPP